MNMGIVGSCALSPQTDEQDRAQEDRGTWSWVNRRTKLPATPESERDGR